MTDPFDLWLQTPESDTRTFDEFVADGCALVLSPALANLIGRPLGAPIVLEADSVSIFRDVHIESTPGLLIVEGP